jgi:hypothetical protein
VDGTRFGSCSVADFIIKLIDSSAPENDPGWEPGGGGGVNKTSGAQGTLHHDGNDWLVG